MRRAVLVPIVTGALAAAVLAHGSRDPAPPADSHAITASPRTVVREMSAPSVSARSADRVTDVSRSIEAARGIVPHARVEAIAALANAPPEQAVPVLKDVLEFGARDPDRQVALQSLHTLAVSSGDRDGRIRDTLRYIVYHGDDDAVTESAQLYLEDLEIALSSGS